MHLLQEEGAGAREASAAAGHADVAVALPPATALKLRVTDEMLPAYLEPLTYDVARTDDGDADGDGDGEGEDGEDGGLSEVELGERRGSLRALHSERLRAVVVALCAAGTVSCSPPLLVFQALPNLRRFVTTTVTLSFSFSPCQRPLRPTAAPPTASRRRVPSRAN